MRVFSNMSFGLRPLKTYDVHVRLDPAERNIIEEAATLDGKNLSEFIRNAALKAASEVFDKNILERQTRRQKQQEQQKEPYLA